MNDSELIFVGIKGSVIALRRDTGEKVWTTRLKGVEFVNLVLDHRQLLATTHGEIFCLEPQSGNLLWHNPLKGFGLGLATIATPSGGNDAIVAEKRRRDEAGSAAATAAACS